MKSKGFLVLCLLVTFFSVIITPAYATTTPQQQSPVFATEQMPAWLAEAGAVPVADVALENVQGEFSLVEFYFYSGITWWAFTKYVSPITQLLKATEVCSLVGWESGRTMAVASGLPDPGRYPNSGWISKTIYYLSKVK